MKKKLFSFVLALSLICTAVVGLGTTAGAAAEDEKIVEFTAAAMQTEYDNRTNKDDSAATVMARLGVKIDTSANACWGGTSLQANAQTGNVLVIGYGFRNTDTEKHGGWFDFTADSTVNPSPAAMTDGTYMVEAQVVNYIYDSSNRISHIRYELCGTAGSETKSIAQLKFDHKTDKINLIDASGTVIGASSAETFGQNKPIPGYVRFVVDMNNKTYSVYYAKHTNVSALGTVPESLTVLAQNQPFLNDDVTQLKQMNIFGLFPGGGNTEAGFYSVKASKMADTVADKETATYDKNDGGTLDVTLTPVTHRLQKITVDDTDLAAEYYTVSGDTYTIAEEALKALSVGSHTLKFVMDGGASPEVALTVGNNSSAPTYTVTASSTDEAKGTAAVTSLGTEFEAGASVEVTATPKAGYEFTGWTAAGVTLTEEQKTQNPLTITMPAENVTFTAAFDYKALNWVLDPVELEAEYKKTPDGATTNGQLTWLPGAAGVQPNTTNAYAWTNNIISANDTHKKMSLFIKWRKQDGKAPAYGIGSSYDFAANTTFNPNPKPIKNGSYCLEMDFNANLNQANTYVDYVFKGNSGNVLIVRADQASGTVSLRDSDGNVIGTAHTLASKTTTAVYLRLEFDMNQKKLNAWAGSYAAVSDVGVKVGNAPALSSCTKLVMDSSFLSQSEQLIGMDIYAQKGVSADGPISNVYGMKITELEDITPPLQSYTVTANSADETKGTAVVTTAGTAFEAGTSVTVEATPKAGNKFTGWTATGITLTEAQKTQNPLTITMPAANVTLSAAFAAKTNASVTPQAANYDKYAEHANHKDIAVTLTPGEYTFRALKNSTTTLTLTEGTDYTVSGNVYTIKTSYLDTLAKGERTLMFEMDGGTNPTVVITVENSTPTPPPTYTVTTASADAAKGTAAVKTGEGGPFEAGVRVTIEATPTAGNKFTGWTATGITLTEEQKTQNPLMIFMPAENVTLTATFEEKTNAAVTPATASYDKYIEHANHKEIAVTLAAGDYTFSALKNGAAALTAETDYTVSGNVYTIKTSYLDTMANGAQTLTFEMDGGVNPTVVITVANSTPTTPGQTAHIVTVSAGTGGTARVGGDKTEFLPGEIVTVEAAVGSGYSFGSWKATGAALYPNGTSATFTMPNNDVTVYATFIKDRQSGGGGGGGTQRGSSTKAGVVVVPENTGTSGTSDNNYRKPDVDHVSSNYFADVSTESTWAYGYIEHLAAAGIVSGDQNRNFAPKTNVTREEFLKMLMGALNITATDGGYGFSDIGNDDWFAPYVYTARNLGIVNGMGDGTFGIGQTITREDMAVMASRALAAAGKTLTQTQQTALVDAVQISDYAQSAAQQLASAGVICGDEHAAFRPQDTALREEAAKVIYYIWVA